MSSVPDAVDDGAVVDNTFVNGVVDGVAVGGAGPVVVTDESVFVGAFTVVCLFPGLEDTGGTEDDGSCRRRLSDGDS